MPVEFINKNNPRVSALPSGLCHQIPNIFGFELSHLFFVSGVDQPIFSVFFKGFHEFISNSNGDVEV